MRVIILCFTLLGMLPLAGTGQDAKETFIRMYPAVIEFDCLAGAKQTKTVYVVNDKQKAYRFRAVLKDWGRDSSGYHMFFQKGTHPNSCAPWLHIDSNDFIVPPGQKARIDVHISVPPSATPDIMKWTMLFFEFSDTASADPGPKSTFRLGSHIYYTHPRQDRSFKIDLQSFRKLNIKNEYRITAFNGGSTQQKCTFALELNSDDTANHIILKQTDISILPGDYRNVDFQIPDGVVPGKYKAKTTIYTDDDKKSAETLEYTIEII